MSKKLGRYLREVRRRNGITLRAVEKKTGISNAYLSQLENSKISKPSPSILHKLADYYKISYEHLMQLSGYPGPELKKRILTPSFRLESRFNDVTDEEAEKLAEYFEFLRSRRKK